jgi:hypothetical protein
MSSVNESWEKFLHPQTLKDNLVAISLFITAFEIFKSSVIEKPQSFFTNGFVDKELTIDEAYKNEVLSKSKHKLTASLLWFKELGAIDDDDLIVFDLIRQHRNEIAHEPLEFLSSSERNFDLEKFPELINLLKKIELWWFINFELAIDPDMLPEGTSPQDVIPGSVWSLQLLFDIALGNEPEEGYYYKSFKENKI